MEKPESPTASKGDVRFQPSQYMRARHPDLFSDTLPVNAPKLDKGRFEYHLDTLTSRKQEQEFEEFCRRLVEAEICPNLKPQTGPTGGGDSKVDASTYPVERGLSTRCWWGSPARPSDGAWAFAFSCKKEWKPKVKEDIEKIANLKAAFTVAYFITNQFARDKDRGYIEQELTRKHGIEVHILDRTWIVNRIIERNHEDIAIEELGIRDEGGSTSKLGPHDTVRQHDLTEILKCLQEPSRYHGNDYALAQEYRRAALLARGLEKPRHEVDGLFDRALTIAENYGYPGLILRIGYDWGWTSLWWFDDPIQQERVYSRIEHCIANTRNAEDCGLLARQWRLLHASALHGATNPVATRVDERLQAIKIELSRLAAEGSRPNNALQARTETLLLDLHLAVHDSESAERLFTELKECLRQSEGLGMYPVMEFVHFLANAGAFYGEYPGYDSLFEEIRAVARNRLSDTEEAKLMYNRALQLAEKNRHGDVLRYMGKARVGLFKEETMKEGIRATLACSEAYANMGLYWAARMDAVTAAHGAMRSHESLDEYAIEATAASIQMSWLELRLGRVVPFLAWHEVSLGLIGKTASMQYDTGPFVEAIETQQGVLGCLFLCMDASKAKEYAGLVRTLDELDLPMARWALLYSLGDITSLESEWRKDVPDRRADIEEFFSMWKEQPASEDVPRELPAEASPYLELSTLLFGVRYLIRTRSALGPILMAENILGTLEATLALANWENLAFIIDEMKISIDENEDGKSPPDVEFPDPPNDQILHSVWAPGMLEWMNDGDRDRVATYLKTVLFTILLRVTVDPLDDLKSEFDEWHLDDAPTRALGTSPISIALTDILGDRRYDLAHWCEAPAAS